MSYKIYVINLPHRSDRLNHVKSLLNGVDFKVIDGVTLSFEEAMQLDVNKTAPGFPGNTALYRGTIGCVTAHINALKDIIHSSHPEISLVLQDDVSLVPKTEDLDIIVKEVSSIDPLWNMIFVDVIGHGKEDDIVHSVTSPIKFCIYKPTCTYPAYWGSHCCLVRNSESAKLLVRFMHKIYYSTDYMLVCPGSYATIHDPRITGQNFSFGSDRVPPQA